MVGTVDSNGGAGKHGGSVRDQVDVVFGDYTGRNQPTLVGAVCSPTAKTGVSDYVYLSSFLPSDGPNHARASGLRASR